MIRVAYVDHTAKWSGGEIALYNILTHMVQEGRDPVHPLVILAEDGPLGEKLRASGIDTFVLPLDRSIRNRSRHKVKSDFIGSLLGTMRYSRRLAQLLQQEQVDCVHTNSLKAAIYGAIAAKLARLPLVWHIRDQISPPYLHAFVAGAIRLMARLLPNGIIANSGSTLSTLKLSRAKRSKQERMVLYSGYAGRIGREIPEPYNRPEGCVENGNDDFIILMAGRIDEWKGHMIMLEVARQLLEQPRVKIWIAGDALFGQDAYKQKLVDFIAEARLSNVFMLGHVDDMGRLMRQADLLVHASVMPEPFGQVIVEGMAAGLPVIASNEGGPTEIVVHGETGLLISPGQPAVLKEATQWMIDNPDHRRKMGDAGMQRVRERFSIGIMAGELQRFYTELLRRRRRNIHDRPSQPGEVDVR